MDGNALAHQSAIRKVGAAYRLRYILACCPNLPDHFSCRRAVFAGQISPRDAGAQDVENSVDHAAVIHPLSSFSADIFPELRAFDSVPFERFAVFAACPSVSFMVFLPVFKGGFSWFSYRSEYTYRKRPPIGGLHVS